MRSEPTAAQVEALAQGVAAPGESWEAARMRAVRLLTAVSTCRPCACCDPEDLARYRLPLGWIEGDGEMCRSCLYYPGADYTLAGPIDECEGLDGKPIQWQHGELGYRYHE